jgi:hypothetical protein
MFSLIHIYAYHSATREGVQCLLQGDPPRVQSFEIVIN